MDVNTNLSIGEFARATGLSVSAVRFYADRGLLTPAYVDDSNGYRWFAPAQVEIAVLIRDLRQVDVGLSDVETALTMDRAQVAQFVEQHADGLEDNVRRARQVATTLATPTQGNTASAVVPGSDLGSAIDQVLPFVCTDTGLPHLLTVRIEAKEGSVRFVATDTHRLALRDLVAVQSGSGFAGLVAASTLAKIRSDITPAGHVTLSIDDTTLTFSEEARSFSAPLVPATFPDYERFLAARDQASTVVVAKSELVAAFERNAGHDTIRIALVGQQLQLGDDDSLVQLTTTSPSPTPQVSAGETVTFINPALGLDCAGGAIGSDVAIEIPTDEQEPLSFRSATDGTYTSLLMPVKVAST